MEYLVTYEQAVSLKKFGFDWKCYAFYNEDEELYKSNNSEYWNDEVWQPAYSAPNLAQAQKWLREVEGIIILIDIVSNGFYWKLYDSEFRFIGPSNENFGTYERALLSGISKSLEILEENNDKKE